MGSPQPSTIGRVAPGTAYTTGNDLFTAAITPPFPGRLRINLAVSAAAVAYFRIGGVNLEMNSGAALGADRCYTFFWDGGPEDAFNIRFGANVTIRYCRIVLGEG